MNATNPIPPYVPVVVVGAGPTGITAATLLAKFGIHTLVLDRWEDVYPQPRAVHADDEVFRILASLGIRDEFAAISRPALGLRLLDPNMRVLVDPNWGDGVCRQCHEGNEQLCSDGQLLGFGPPGGFAEYMAVPHRHVIAVPDRPDRKPETLAPLTDAGLTPYRGMKKLRAAGKLGADRIVVVNGIGGLGSYAVQYAKLLGGGATVVAFARSDEKLALARENGADHTVNTRHKNAGDVQNELEDLTGRRDVDAVLDCAGAEESLALGFSILAAEGALTSVGLIGQRAELPLFPFVSGEKSYFGSFWGNYNDLTEVLSLADEGLIKHTINPVKLDDINDRLEALGRGDVVGRAVVVFE